MLVRLTPPLVREVFELIKQSNKISYWKNPRLIKSKGVQSFIEVEIGLNPNHIFGVTINMPQSIKAYNKIEADKPLLNIDIFSVTFLVDRIHIRYVANSDYLLLLDA